MCVDCLPVTCPVCPSLLSFEPGLTDAGLEKALLFPVSTLHLAPGRSWGSLTRSGLGSSPGGAVPFYRWGAGGCKVKYGERRSMYKCSAEETQGLKQAR